MLPQYRSARAAALLRRRKKRRLGQTNEGLAVSPSPLRAPPPTTNRSVSPAMGSLTNRWDPHIGADQWGRSPAPPASLQNSEACSQQHRSPVSRLKKKIMFYINGRTRLDSSCRARVCFMVVMYLCHIWSGAVLLHDVLQAHVDMLHRSRRRVHVLCTSMCDAPGPDAAHSHIVCECDYSV